MRGALGTDLVLSSLRALVEKRRHEVPDRPKRSGGHDQNNRQLPTAVGHGRLLLAGSMLAAVNLGAGSKNPDLACQYAA